jgi:hypothetical protein
MRIAEWIFACPESIQGSNPASRPAGFLSVDKLAVLLALFAIKMSATYLGTKEMTLSPYA